MSGPYWKALTRPDTSRLGARMSSVERLFRDQGKLPTRVLIVDHTADLGGAELALCRLLSAVGDVADVRVLLFADGPLASRLRQQRVSVHVLRLSPDFLRMDRHAAGRSAPSALVNAVRTFPHVIRLTHAIRASKSDVVHTTSLKADLLGVPATLLARKPLVWYIHDRISNDYLPGPLVGLLRALGRLVPRIVIANSQATAETLPGIRDLVIAYPGFSPEQVGPSPAERTLPGRPVVGLLGRISPTKGQLEFVRAAPQVIREHPDAIFRIIGAPLFGHEGYAQRVRMEAQSLGISDHIEFSGHTDEPAKAIDGLSIMVHASPTPEPFGQVIVEAMIRGVPVIATDAGGASEIMRPEPSGEPLGWLVPPGDTKALGCAIIEALATPEEAQRRAMRAYSSACDRFPVSRTAEVVKQAWTRASDRRP